MPCGFRSAAVTPERTLLARDDSHLGSEPVQGNLAVGMPDIGGKRDEGRRNDAGEHAKHKQLTPGQGTRMWSLRGYDISTRHSTRHFLQRSNPTAEGVFGAPPPTPRVTVLARSPSTNRVRPRLSRSAGSSSSSSRRPTCPATPAAPRLHDV